MVKYCKHWEEHLGLERKCSVQTLNLMYMLRYNIRGLNKVTDIIITELKKGHIVLIIKNAVDC